MAKDRSMAQLASAATIAALLLSGCAQMQSWLTGRQVAEPREDLQLDGATSTDAYLQELQELTNGDPFSQVEIHADAEAAATLTPNPSTRLRYALVLATPGHAAADPEKAASMLRELLAQTEMMTQSEVALASVYLKNTDERLVLAAEMRRLQSANSAAQSAEQRAVSQRIQRIEAENARLRDELASTEEKLEALTSIERSIRAQDEDGNQ